MKLSDEKCRKPTRATIVESIGKNKQVDVDKIDVRNVDAITSTSFYFPLFLLPLMPFFASFSMFMPIF
jgi:hypothetical protein